jgi:hypothetical protein
MFPTYHREIVIYYSHNTNGRHARGNLLGKGNSTLMKVFSEAEEVQFIRPPVLR